MKAGLPVVVIVGRPNVGKSTLFNRLVGKRIAVIEDQPGITRDRLYAEATWKTHRMKLVDTGGILFSDDDPLIEQIRVQAQVALAEADLVLFVVDCVDGVMPDDQELANHLRGAKSPVLIVANKADHPNRAVLANDFYALGLGEVFPVSGLHGRGIAELLDHALTLLPEAKAPEEAHEELRLAIIGRPNVGKSSLLNAFTGQKRAIVSNIPGTTRDTIDTQIEYQQERFRLIDTAGIRRKGKIQGTFEYYTVLRAQRALERADCSLVVVDAEEGLTDQDKRVAKMSHDMGRAMVIAVNKWDLVEPPDGHPRKPSDEKREFRKNLLAEVPELNYAAACFTSAIEGAGLELVLDTVLSAVESWTFRVSTGNLNRLLQDAFFERPLTRKGKALKLYYCTQVSARPPTFVLFVNDPDLMHFSYQRYIENQLRKVYPMRGTPIRIFVRSSRGRDEEA